MASLDDVLAEVRALRAEVAELRSKETAPVLRGVTLLARHLGAVKVAPDQQPGQRVASDAEIEDPEWGDKEIRKDPPRWKGESYRGMRWSEAPPDYLLALAGFIDFCAGKKREEAKSKVGDEAEKLVKYAGYDETDAAKVRAWAKRMGGARTQAPQEDEGL